VCTAIKDLTLWGVNATTGITGDFRLFSTLGAAIVSGAAVRRSLIALAHAIIAQDGGDS